MDEFSESHPVAKWRRMFAQLTPSQPMPLDDVYAAEVAFEDPFRRIEERKDLGAYFAKLNANIVSCTFAFGDALIEQPAGRSEGAAAIPWTMNLILLRGPRRPIAASGMSHLRFGERITYHRDYVDAGQMVYEHVPVLGSIIRKIKGRM